MGNLLDWLVPSSSSTLLELHYGGNEIESIPSQMTSFPIVNIIYLMNNVVDLTIGSNSFVMSSNPSEYQVIYLTSSRIVRVESDAFKGIILKNIYINREFISDHLFFLVITHLVGWK